MEEEVNRLKKKYKVKAKMINDVIMIDSGIDEWMIEVFGDIVLLKHKNTKYKTNHYHEQGTFRNLELAFRSIVSHEKRLRNRYNKMPRVYQLLKNIAN